MARIMTTKSVWAWTGITLASLAVLWVQPLWSLQTRKPAPPPRPPAELLRLSLAAETPGLAEPFTGIRTKSGIEQNLFGIRSTGVSTEPVRAAADAFLASLTPAQRGASTFPVESDEWRRWMNQSFYVRRGVSFLEMTEGQRDAAFGLLSTGLSARGLTLTRDIMRLNHTLGELTDNNFEEYGEWLYHLTVMGVPSPSEPWGWQIDGHHLIINYFVLGDQVVMTPTFTGSEPATAVSGKYAGTTILRDEQQHALALVNGLSDAQRAKAVLSFSKVGNNILTEAWKDNVVLDYAGIPATDLTAPQRRQLLELAALYVNNMAEGHARVRMDEVRSYLDRTWFAWIGRTDPGSVFYYRIHSPVILIEFDHNLPVGLRHLADPTRPDVEHIHTIVRTPNGNDYGKDLLRQHYQQHPH
jgi:hypothetical protein